MVVIIISVSLKSLAISIIVFKTDIKKVGQKERRTENTTNELIKFTEIQPLESYNDSYIHLSEQLNKEETYKEELWYMMGIQKARNEPRVTLENNLQITT